MYYQVGGQMGVAVGLFLKNENPILEIFFYDDMNNHWL